MYNLERNFKNKHIEIKILGEISQQEKEYLRDMTIQYELGYSILTGMFINYNSLTKVLIALRLFNTVLISVQFADETKLK